MLFLHPDERSERERYAKAPKASYDEKIECIISQTCSESQFVDMLPGDLLIELLLLVSFASCTMMWFEEHRLTFDEVVDRSEWNESCR